MSSLTTCCLQTCGPFSASGASPTLQVGGDSVIGNLSSVSGFKVPAAILLTVLVKRHRHDDLVTCPGLGPEIRVNMSPAQSPRISLPVATAQNLKNWPSSLSRRWWSPRTLQCHRLASRHLKIIGAQMITDSGGFYKPRLYLKTSVFSIINLKFR